MKSTYKISWRHLLTKDLDCTVAYIRSFLLPTRYGGKLTGFTPTGSIGSVVDERYPSRRAPLRTRLYHILFDCGAWFHAMVIVLFAIIALRRTQRAIQGQLSSSQGQLDLQNVWIHLLREVFWPSHPWMMTVIACITPIKYAISPPVVGERDKLLGKRGKYGARYPLPEYRDKVDCKIWDADFAQLYSVFMIFTLGVFVSTWWFDIDTVKINWH
jgi:hypothetical protein